MVDAAVGGSAHRVIAVTPWYGYSRQDKKSAPREPISARLVARMLEAAGIDRILTMDLHSGQIQGFFQKPCDHMTALFMLTQYFADLGLEDLVVVAPDAGRVKLNKKFAAKIGADLAILNKERPAQQVAEISYVIGDVRGQDRADRRRHDRHRRHARRPPPRPSATPAPAASTPPPPTATSPATPGRTWPRADFEQVVVTDTIPLPPGAPDNVRVLSVRRPADQLDPPDLHRRIGQRRVRRREPAVLSSRAPAIGLDPVVAAQGGASRTSGGPAARTQTDPSPGAVSGREDPHARGLAHRIVDWPSRWRALRLGSVNTQRCGIAHLPAAHGQRKRVRRNGSSSGRRQAESRAVRP